MRNLQLTEVEEETLAQMAVFFSDLGLPDEFDQDAFNSLFEKITEPSIIHEYVLQLWEL